MKHPAITRLLLGIIIMVISHVTSAQLVVTETNSAQALVQKLLGTGVVVSNVSVTPTRNGIIPTGLFNNLGGTTIPIDSGIVITNGRAKTNLLVPNQWGVDGNGTTSASSRLAQADLRLPGDADLAAEIGVAVGALNDAIALEFDFIPLGDTVRFNYILSSEEYTPGTVCTFNDAFGFFISGPGITGKKNIALVPGTNMPVTIKNVNNITSAGCVNNPLYYVSDGSNVYVTHEGHTTLFTAVSEVQPCQTYHLKLVVADQGDHIWDTGVFLQAKSLSSNVIAMDNHTQTDNQGNSYLVEGCATGAFNVTRPRKEPSPLAVTLSYGGVAINGVDYQLLPTIVTIPANDSFVTVNVVPIIDNIPEGIERLVVYAVGGCLSGEPTDSTVIQLRDYDTLGVIPKVANICRQSSVQLIASSGYTVYQWDADPTLSSTTIYNPVASPPNSTTTTYYCTATEGACHGRDSAVVTTKGLDFIAKQDVNCRNGTTGFIHVAAGTEWLRPVEFSINGGPWQADSNFNNLPAGTYTIRLRDINCIDSLTFNVVQAYPDLVVNNLAVVAATCSGNPDGIISLTPGGGNGVYSYSIDGINFQPSNGFYLGVGGPYTFTVKDGNGCTVTQTGSVPLNNTVTLEAGPDKDICEGTSYLIPATSNGTTFDWTPATTLTNSTSLNPTAAPLSGIVKYYVTAKTGICTQVDSMTIRVLPAPTAFAGPDAQLCLGHTIQLNGAGGVTYQWYPSTYFQTPTTLPDPTIKPKVDIKYWLIVTDANGCNSLSADTLQVIVTPTVKIFAGNDTVAAINQPIQLHVKELSNAGVTTFTWEPGTFLDNASSDSPIAILPYDYTYIVKGFTNDGCEGGDEIKIKVYKGPEIYVPSGFTPDNDWLNDILRAIPVGMKEFHYFRVFNRWGQMVFTTKDPAMGWNGKINGVEQGTGTYIWMAEAIDFKGNLITRKGVVTIVK